MGDTKGIHFHPPSKFYRAVSQLLGASMWFFMFYRMKKDGPIILGLKHPWEVFFFRQNWPKNADLLERIMKHKKNIENREKSGIYGKNGVEYVREKLIEGYFVFSG
ncbi:hypothetical protein T552_02338 [Pneumocystis carinii B80]|uniref:Uncharacterized protein n=1 Tax=Pneumocystis carinii (strain B80) TaxID=1408658 RepID=A0A0W4ZG53_PNEC8|nr:hypothetical protein T552_02338 [Pneumocystis carinii B80]KTW27359.1 hypothetical protein T552_02338 [Pneumocystis carinii B80]